MSRSLAGVLVADVLIVGAGPAGVAAAVPLAAAGRHVVVVDKAVFPRDKCCGDGLTTLALRELELLGFEPSTVTDWQVVRDAVLRSPSGRQVVVPLPTGPGMFAAVAPRAQLDAALVDVAIKAGATVLQGHGADGTVSPRADHVVVGLDEHEPVAARYVIAADGMWSPVRKALGLGEPGYLGEWHAFRQYVRDVDGPAGEHLYVWFDADLLPGYAWSFPLPDGRANVGLRRAARRHPADPGDEAAVGRPARAAARARRARRLGDRRRAATRRGRSRPASTGPRSPTGACCSPATRRWPRT